MVCGGRVGGVEYCVVAQAGSTGTSCVVGMTVEQAPKWDSV